MRHIAVRRQLRLGSDMGSADTSGIDRRAIRIPLRLRDLGMTGGGRVGDGTLLSEPVLFMNQNLGFLDDRVEYLVFSRHGQQLGVLASVPRSGTRLHVADVQGRSYFELVRRGEGRKAEMLVTSPDGSPMGQVRRQRGILEKAIADSEIGQAVTGVGEAAGEIAMLPLLALHHIPFVGKPLVRGILGGAGAVGEAISHAATKGKVTFCIDDAGSNRLGVVVADADAPTEFTILDVKGEVAARIVKAPQVLAREEFTKAVNYAVEFPRLLDEPFRTLALATAVAIGPVFQHLGT